MHHAVKDVDIHRATRDQRTRSLAATAIISPFATGLKLPLVNRKHSFHDLHVWETIWPFGKSHRFIATQLVWLAGFSSGWLVASCS
jgi:hypothetical protein